MSEEYKILTDFLDKLPSNKKYNDLKIIQATDLIKTEKQNYEIYGK